MSRKVRLMAAILSLAALALACSGGATFPDPQPAAPSVRFSGLYQCGTQRNVLEGYSNDGSCPRQIGNCYLIECY